MKSTDQIPFVFQSGGFVTRPFNPQLEAEND